MTIISSIIPMLSPISFNIPESIPHLSPTSQRHVIPFPDLKTLIPDSSAGRRLKKIRPRPPPLRLGIIEEEASSSEYEFGTLNLGAESPRSNHSTTSLLDNSAYVRQWAEAGIAVPRVPARKLLRSSSFSRDRHRSSSSMKDDDRDCGICFEYAVRPCRTLCCGKIFCTEHLADWLHGPNAEGRCPNCENACSLEGGTLSLSSPPLLATAQSPSRRHPLTPSNRSPYHPSPLTFAQPRSNDTLRDQPPSEVVLRIPDDAFSSSTSTTLVSDPAFSSTTDEDANEHHYPHNMKGSFTQLGSASASAINLSTTPFSSSWGAVSRLMSIITFLMFIYKLLS